MEDILSVCRLVSLQAFTESPLSWGIKVGEGNWCYPQNQSEQINIVYVGSSLVVYPYPGFPSLWPLPSFTFFRCIPYRCPLSGWTLVSVPFLIALCAYDFFAAHALSLCLGGGGGGGEVVTQSVERATPLEEVPGSIPTVAARSLLVGSVSV